jgi:hypothetical protein
MNFHSWKMWLGLAVVFVVGGLQALNGLNWSNGIEIVLPVLLAIEHALNGNTTPPSPAL